MSIVMWIVFVAALPVIILGAIVLLYFVYVPWMLLLSICGVKWAQDHVRSMMFYGD